MGSNAHLKEGSLRREGRDAGSFGAQRALILEAWLEWRVNAQHRGAALDDLEVRPPGWFVREELGFAFEHGPSLRWTLSTLAVANARAVKQLGTEAPWRLLPNETRGPRRPRRNR